MRTFHDLQEGVYDPNILKAFFLAGGPGSGKSYVVARGAGGLGLRVVNSDDTFEKLLKDANMSLDIRELDPEVRDSMRGVAKGITKRQQSNYLMGRLGLVIDGTGKNYDKITTQATNLKQLGYDVHMIFVNTSLDTAIKRNAERPRKLPNSVVTQSWNDVQKNIGKFSQYFRQNFMVVDNNDSKEDVMTPVYKQVMSLAKKNVQNRTGQSWIANELQKKGVSFSGGQSQFRKFAGKQR